MKLNLKESNKNGYKKGFFTKFLDKLDIAAGISFYPTKDISPGEKYMLVELCCLYLLANSLIDENTCKKICEIVEKESGFGENTKDFYINRDFYIKEIMGKTDPLIGD